MATLSTEHRRLLERTIVDARALAERAARAALEALAVGRAKPDMHMSDEQKALRNHLRARARQLGDKRAANDTHEITHLVRECAYEHWHRMLFARFLAENNLLIEPDAGVAISLDECKELAKDEKTDLWTLAGRYAQRMLPQIFRADDPVLQVRLAREHELKLEGAVDGLPADVFTATDSLGWCYQFWQTAEKKRVNESEKKIGADELPAVTQLFTEDYMVDFLLDNTLGAWWAGKVAAASSRWSQCQTEDDCRSLTALPGCPWKYLRFVREEQRRDAAATLGFFHKDEPVDNLTGDLPHWRQSNVTYFVTFRCADSLPAEKLAQWRDEMKAWLAAHPEPHDQNTRKEFYERFPERMQRWLDAGHGRCLLAKEAHKALVANALRHFDGERYALDEFIVAPNHVHALVTPRAGYELSDILHSWKSFTANKINEAEGISGTFWQKETFDHIVRNERSLAKFREYIRGHKVAEASSLCGPEEQRQDAAATLLWKPAAGTFDGWPKTVKELTCMDPCCGSGHFLVALFERLAVMRMAEEGLSKRDAAESVIRDNIFGLEIDPRCTQIAAFNLALAAWKVAEASSLCTPEDKEQRQDAATTLPTANLTLPPMNIACCGLAPNCTKEQWIALAEEAASRGGLPAKRDLFVTEDSLLSDPVRGMMTALYELFSQAPVLGSLINPRDLPHDLFHADYRSVAPLLTAVLSAQSASDDARERAVAAAGMAKAAELLAGRYTLVATNVPYLGTKKQDDVLKDYCERIHPEAKADLATCFIERCFAFCVPGGGTTLVTPQNWLFLRSYNRLRERLLAQSTWNILGRLGPKGFQTPMWDFNIILLGLTAKVPASGHSLCGVDVSTESSPEAKSSALIVSNVQSAKQSSQMANPDSRIGFAEETNLPRLTEHADCLAGIMNGDSQKFIKKFWEFGTKSPLWAFLQSTVPSGVEVGGLESVILFDEAAGHLREEAAVRRVKLHNADERGNAVWGRHGVAVSQMSSLPVSRYFGNKYDSNIATIVPKDAAHVAAVWAFCKSPDFYKCVRALDQKLNVTNATFGKVPFDLTHWQKIAAEKYPNGLPEPESDDPTQWLFHGCPEASTAPLQVAVVRLLGYRWPAENDTEMRLSARAHSLVNRCDELLSFADKDGIVCIPSVRGEPGAADRLLALLSAAGCRGHHDLDDWLRNSFFEEHCKLFHDRPFVWHIWDGRKRDGFHALVNYHKLADGLKGRRLLEKLTHAYLGDWITRQRAEVKDGKEGADARLAAALALKERLEAIIAGEPPFDIFVRWKPLAKQAIGWEPDINDGVRMNIRPFMASDLPACRDVRGAGRPGGKKGAGVLRVAPKIKWTKDRGKEPNRPKDKYPWFWGWEEKTKDFMGGKAFDGNRWNDCHYSNDVKRKARKTREE